VRFKSSTNRSPRQANPGQPGIERTLILRLKLIADAGLLGLPNAGKSTFQSTVTNARPKIGAYPFTTLHPGLGVVGIDGREFVLADIPGLIAGASDGPGLGDRFLGHVERCAVLLHLVDGTAEDVAEDYRIIMGELEGYGGGLVDKPRIVGLNKIDALSEEEVAERVAALEGEGAGRVMPLSGVSGTGVQDVLRAMWAEVVAYREAAEPATDEPWTP
jgi:GTP-binding protein